jgi:NADPH:quinone reductase-like Zn-dependent oxidoreductase
VQGPKEFMKAVIIEKYGGPEVFRFADAPDPAPGPGDLLVRVAATSVNPFDIKQRTGAYKSFAPVKFPGILGGDFAGTVVKCGAAVKKFEPGDHVFAVGSHTYAELCVVSANNAAKIPPHLHPVDAAALPVAVTTGHQLAVKGVEASSGQLILITGAVGSVGRSAVFVAKSRGARVIAGVRKSQVGAAQSLGADQVVALDDPKAVADLPELDAVADTVNGATAEFMLGKVKSGGIFASVLGPPANADKYPKVKIVPVFAEPDPAILELFGEAIVNRKFAVPVAAKFPLAEAPKAHQMIETEHPLGKVLLLP